MTYGETTENPIFDWMNLIRAGEKCHTIVMHVFYEILFVRRFPFGGIAFLSVFDIETINSYASNKIFYG